MKKLLTVCVAAVLLLSLTACGKTDTDTITDSKADKPAAETAGVGTHHAEIDIQDYGTITVELDGDVQARFQWKGVSHPLAAGKQELLLPLV